MQERLAIAGAGTIAVGLAAPAAQHGEVVLWARSDASAQRATATVAKHCAKLAGLEQSSDRVSIVTDLDELGRATFLVEAVVEDTAHKQTVLAEMGKVAIDDAVVAGWVCPSNAPMMGRLSPLDARMDA